MTDAPVGGAAPPPPQNNFMPNQYFMPRVCVRVREPVHARASVCVHSGCGKIVGDHGETFRCPVRLYFARAYSRDAGRESLEPGSLPGKGPPSRASASFAPQTHSTLKNIHLRTHIPSPMYVCGCSDIPLCLNI